MKSLFAFASMFATGQLLWAAPVIDLGQYQLLPNLAHQPVDIYVTGGDAVAGVNVYLQIGNGTDTLAAPTIESVDILSNDMVFGANNTGAVIGDDYPHEMSVSTTTIIGTVPAAGKLATLYVDTSGYSSGSWSLILGSYSAQGPDEYDKPATDFAGTPIDITDGSIVIAVPEPVCLAFLGTAGLLLRGRNRQDRLSQERIC